MGISNFFNRKSQNKAKYWVGEALKINVKPPQINMGPNGMPDVQIDTESIKAVLECYDKALEQDPKYVPALMGKAQLLVTLNRKSEAEKTIETLLRVDPNNELGNSLYAEVMFG